MTAVLIKDKQGADRLAGRSFVSVHVAAHERGIRTRRGDYLGVLRPGTHVNPAFIWHGLADRVTLADTREVELRHPLLDAIVRDASLRDELEVVDLPAEKRALVWVDGRLHDIVAPQGGLRAFWKVGRRLAVEVFDVSELRLTHRHLSAVLAHPAAGRHLTGVVVDEHEVALLSVDGKIVETLRAGLHVFWKDAGRVLWRAVDLRERQLDVSGQELMTSDKVSLRVNLSVTWSVTDPLKSVSVSGDAEQAVYREAQLALRRAVGGRTLDELLADKHAASDEVAELLAGSAGPLGVDVRSVGLRDVILPGDMRELFNAVLAARKESEANLIRRREETAAARSQANTARLMAENPQLARLKELELLREVLAGADLRVTLATADGDLAGQLRDAVAGK